MKDYLLNYLLRFLLYCVELLDKNAVKELHNGMRINKTQCEWCDDYFIKKTVWQKYCKTKCRLAANEAKNGEKLSLKQGE